MKPVKRKAQRSVESEAVAAAAMIVAVGEGDAVRVRMPARGTKKARRIGARVAVPGYVASIGDRVVVLEAESAFVVGVLRAAGKPTLRTDAGATVQVDGDRVEVRDAAGALVLTWDGRETQVASPGDLRLAAQGKVIVEAGADLELRSATRAAVTAPVLETTSDRGTLHARELEISADALKETADAYLGRFGKHEVHAQRLIEKACEVFREVEGLLDVRTGRARTLVREAYRLLAGRTDIASREDTTIDGKRVLLG